MTSMYIMLLKAIVLTVLFFLCYMYQSTKKIGLLSDLKKNYITAFCYNIDTNYGEDGDIFVASDNGAIIRIDL